jgi:hypothetical protein
MPVYLTGAGTAERKLTGGMMKNGRNIAITAAIAWVLSAPVAVGPQAARADELGDLRANQQLMQERIDQLAQAKAPGNPYGVGVGPGPTTVQMMGGSFPRSFLIPGTDTSIRVGGEARLNVLHWIDGGNPNGVHNTNAGSTGQSGVIPLSNSGAARTRSDHVTIISPAQSKINVETRTPTAWGEARTFIEFDFSSNANFGVRPLAISDNLGFRLRFAYGTLGGLLFGQANSNFGDSDASMETISFSGLVGDPGHSRIPQVRYTMPLSGWGLPGALSISAEQPETDWWSPANGVCGTFGCGAGVNILKAPSPDFTMAWYTPQPWGHVDFSAVIRPTLQAENGLGTIDQTFTGYGFHFGGDVKPAWFGWQKDFLTWHFVYGDAIGSFNNINAGVSGIGLVSNFGAVPAANTSIKPIVAWGGNTGYRHWWSPTVRSNIGAGVYHEDINGLNGAVCNGGSSAAAKAARAAGAAGCGLNKEVVTAAANIFWNPVPFADIGLEYFWGHRLTVGNQRGDENVLLSRFRVQF